jgi:hypothetical protein
LIKSQDSRLARVHFRNEAGRSGDAADLAKAARAFRFRKEASEASACKGGRKGGRRFKGEEIVFARYRKR